MVLSVEELRISRSLAKTIRQGRLLLTLDTAFTDVMVACATIRRPDQEGTWITPAMVDSYGDLHRRGFAHSVEAWRGDTLVGGLYGVSLGAAFFGESMFARERDASKVAFVALVEQLRLWGISLVDCQVHTPHLASLGAREWPRRAFLRALRKALAYPTRLGHWRFETQTMGSVRSRSSRSPDLAAPRRTAPRNRRRANARRPATDG